MLIVGLGNPGEKYAQTRHNLGRMFAKLLENAQPAPEHIFFTSNDFMNVSGKSIADFVRFRKIDPQDLIIIHDELDLPLGRVQLRLGGGAGGHHGVESVTEQLGTDQFWRLRLGIGRPEDQSADMSQFVLSDFTADEKETIKTILDETVIFLVQSLENGLQPQSITIATKEPHGTQNRI